MFLQHPIIIFIFSVLVLALPKSHAEESKLPMESTYRINSGNSEVTTIVRNDKTKETLIRNFIFPVVGEALKTIPQVSNVVFVPGKETKEDYSWANYTTIKRESFAYINLSLSSQVSLLFKVNEELRKCKSKETKRETSGSDDWSGSSSNECDITALKSEVTVEGPIAVYGTFVSSVDVNRLLKKKQNLTVSVKLNYSQEFEMETNFNILSSSFEESLMKFFEVFHFTSQIGENFSRRQLLVGVARAMRNINEKVLEL